MRQAYILFAGSIAGEQPTGVTLERHPRYSLVLGLLNALRHSLAFAAITLSTAALLFALLTLAYKVHFLAKSFGDPFRDDALIKAADKLLNGLTFTSIYMHTFRLGAGQ